LDLKTSAQFYVVNNSGMQSNCPAIGYIKCCLNFFCTCRAVL